MISDFHFTQWRLVKTTFPLLPLILYWDHLLERWNFIATFSMTAMSFTSGLIVVQPAQHLYHTAGRRVKVLICTNRSNWKALFSIADEGIAACDRRVAKVSQKSIPRVRFILSAKIAERNHRGPLWPDGDGKRLACKKRGLIYRPIARRLASYVHVTFLRLFAHAWRTLLPVAEIHGERLSRNAAPLLPGTCSDIPERVGV